MKSEHAPDRMATLTIVGTGVLALIGAWLLPWWVMQARAPQYGQRVLVVEVSPRLVDGDVKEMDSLGHYVGIRPLGTVATIERRLAPLGFLAAFAGLVVLPFMGRRKARLVMALPVLILP